MPVNKVIPILHISKDEGIIFHSPSKKSMPLELPPLSSFTQSYNMKVLDHEESFACQEKKLSDLCGRTHESIYQRIHVTACPRNGYNICYEFQS